MCRQLPFTYSWDLVDLDTLYAQYKNINSLHVSTNPIIFRQWIVYKLYTYQQIFEALVFQIRIKCFSRECEARFGTNREFTTLKARQQNSFNVHVHRKQVFIFDHEYSKYMFHFNPINLISQISVNQREVYTYSKCTHWFVLLHP